MDAVYHLNPGELTDDFLKAMQLLYRNRRVRVTVEVEEAEETDLIRANPALHEKLIRRLQSAEAGNVRELNLNEFSEDASANI